MEPYCADNCLPLKGINKAVKESYGKFDVTCRPLVGQNTSPFMTDFILRLAISKTLCVSVFPSLPFCETFVSTCQRPLVQREIGAPEMAGETFCLPK